MSANGRFRSDRFSDRLLPVWFQAPAFLYVYPNGMVWWEAEIPLTGAKALEQTFDSALP